MKNKRGMHPNTQKRARVVQARIRAQYSTSDWYRVAVDEQPEGVDTLLRRVLRGYSLGQT